MRLPVWICYFHVFAGLVTSRPVEYQRTALRDTRDLLGLLGDDANVPANANIITPTVTSTAATPVPTTTTAAIETRASPTRVKMTAASTVASGASEHSVEATSSQASASTTFPSVESAPESSSTSLSITSYAPGVLEDASTTPPAELKQWKVIGIAVITITFLAVLAMAISFFDAWWGFVRAAICGKRRKMGYGGETMIPDWEKRSWEFQLANEDGHRYPTLASLESIVKEKEKARPFASLEGEKKNSFA
ncbi:hypothetical protein JR316_0000331 [Psilocybe cubensis]|uniref:Uncharacterized protein n=2 Tax=Psilocybe cubensis TaxID=181762 RepID=A0A8H7Y752_PSICU|nr:hypothetical protein JR316_0000331 [Psilocybe cubensis]KAH9486267.1 hypothetical protein JR316_0000331 [Psilocybe cubensis]